VLVQDAKVYFAASLLPWKKTYLCAVDAESGAGLYRKEYEHMTAQGPMLASPSKLYVSQGRQTPLVFERESGKLLQSIGGSGFGGVFGLLTEDSMFVHGHGQNHRADGELRFFGGEKKDRLVTFPRATSIVIRAGIVHLHADGQLQAFDRDKYVLLHTQIQQMQQKQKALQEKRKKLDAATSAADRETLSRSIQSADEQISTLQQSIPSCFLWRVASECPLTLILAGDTLFCGGEDRVAAHDRKTGRRLWSASVYGRAYGLAAAGGSLFVSTDLGRIVCLGSEAK
jgi:outer membrane protein assembly factor BamB